MVNKVENAAQDNLEYAKTRLKRYWMTLKKKNYKK
jgi:hypothetical protein